MITTVKTSEAPSIPNPNNLDARRLHDTELVQVMHITLAPGQSVARHTIPVDAEFFVLEGSGIFEIGDEQIEAAKDTLVHSPAHLTRGIVNSGNAPLRVLIIRAPRPAA